MPKLLTIQIPHPCSEDPAGMMPTATGSYCRSCKKEVIDFTGMSDSKLAAFFKNNSGDVCGRFYPDQLNTPIPLPKRELPWLKYFFTIVIPAFLISLKTTAQHKAISAIHLSGNKLHGGSDILIPEYLAAFTGKVIDQNGEPVEAASVQILNSKQGTITDQNGIFKITVDHPGELFVSISGIGIVTREVRLNLKETDIIVERSVDDLERVTVTAASLGINRIRGMLGGAISSVTTSYTTTKAVPKQKDPDEINIYPNPILSGSELSVSWKNKIKADQWIEIFSADGRLVQKEIIRVTGKISACSFVLKNLHPGFYIFMAIDTKTGVKTSREFIVE